MSIDWKEGKWPKQNFLWWFEDGEWFIEIRSEGQGYHVVVRRDSIMVDSLRVLSRGEGIVDHTKRLGADLFEACKARDARPRHYSKV